MQKSKSRFFILISFVFAILFSLSNLNNVQAATSGGYTIKPTGDSTDNVDISKGTYMINGDPGQTVELKLMVLNQESSTRTFVYYATTAYTNANGSLSYDKTKVTDPSLKYQTRKMISPNQSTFKVPGNTSATLTVKLTIPKEKYSGTLMGGISVAPYKEKAKGTVAGNGTLIKNKFSYTIPVQTHQNGQPKIEPKYTVRTVKPGLTQTSKGRKQGVSANVHNSTNAYTGVLSATAVVTEKGNKNFKIKQVYDAQNIAPTTNYDLPISWGKKSLQAGNYHLKLTYKTAGGIKSWVIDKDFTITNNDAAKYNKLAGIKPNYLWLYILLAILALAIILGLGVYLGRRNKNSNGNNNSGNTTRRRRR